MNKLALMSCLLAISCSGAHAATSVDAGRSETPAAQRGSFKVAQASEKEAFESAKELGTVEAWEAFLTNYPTGFHADLARAYVKKLGEPSAPQGQQPPQQTAAPTIMRPSIGRLARAPSQKEVRDQPNAARLTCNQRSGLSTLESVSPARISFINYSDEPFDVFWIDQNGQEQLFGQINPERQAAVETFVTQPWVVKELSGACIAIAVPNPGPQVFVIGASQESEPQPKTTSKKGCGSGKIRVDGKCMTRSAAVGYCGPGYRVSNGSCVHQQQAAPQRPKCPPGQVWSPQELCHYDD